MYHYEVCPVYYIFDDFKLHISGGACTMVNFNSYERTPAAYKVLTMLGHCFNTVGSVWLARHATSGNLVAVKKYDVDKCSNEVLSILQVSTDSLSIFRSCTIYFVFRKIVFIAQYTYELAANLSDVPGVG